MGWCYLYDDECCSATLAVANREKREHYRWAGLVAGPQAVSDVKPSRSCLKSQSQSFFVFAVPIKSSRV